MVVVNIIKVVRKRHFITPPLRVSLEGRAAGARGLRELGLDVHLLHAILLLLKHVVDLGKILHGDTVGNHLQGVNLALLNHLEKLLPVEVDGSLSVADEANTALHQRANVEVVGL